MTWFTWCGEPITDIVQFCKDRGCKLIKYEHTVVHQALHGDGEYTEVTHGYMPEIFYDNMRLDFSSPCKISETYKELGRYIPGEEPDK